MLAIRMQRTGRTGHASFRVIVQDSSKSPTSGKVVAQLGSHDPHSKATILDKEKTAFFLDHGAHPSDRVARLLKQEGVKLPSWVEVATKKTGAIRHADKLRRNRPPGEPAPVAPAEEPVAEVIEPAEEAVVPAVEAVAGPTTAAEKVPVAEPEAAAPAEETAEVPATEEPVAEVEPAAEEPAADAETAVKDTTKPTSEPTA